MMKYVIVVLALIAVASAQLLAYGGYTGANLHPGLASSATTGIRRYGSTAGYLTTGYAAYPGAYYL